MKQGYGQLLLQNKEVQNLLKRMILQKATHYDELHSQLLTEQKIDDSLRGRITPRVIRKILNHHEAQDELTLLKRDLSSTCYQLNKSSKKVPESNKWERAYEYATQVVQIEDVVANLLGVTNLNKNIKCPFHGEDKKPSLKVYSKDNFFICFSCNLHGSPIDFVMQYKNCSFKEAVLYLSNI